MFLIMGDDKFLICKVVEWKYNLNNKLLNVFFSLKLINFILSVFINNILVLLVDGFKEILI